MNIIQETKAWTRSTFDSLLNLKNTQRKQALAVFHFNLHLDRPTGRLSLFLTLPLIISNDKKEKNPYAPLTQEDYKNIASYYDFCNVNHPELRLIASKEILLAYEKKYNFRFIPIVPLPELTDYPRAMFYCLGSDLEYITSDIRSHCPCPTLGSCMAPKAKPASYIYPVLEM